MGVHLSGSVPADPSRPQGILEMIQGGLSGAGGLGGLLAGGLTSIVGGIVGAVQGIAELIGGLFNAGRQDTVAVDAARVAGENAIVAAMSSSVEFLDEIQRVGGAWGNWSRWAIEYGESNPHPIPLTTAFNLAQGTRWHAPQMSMSPDWFSMNQAGNSDHNRGLLARGAGTLELQESGLWMIYFQAAVLQGNQYTTTPSDVWCYVTESGLYCPVGAPGATGSIPAYDRHYGTKISYPVTSIAAYGRAGQYLGTRDTSQGGGNTVSGYMLCYLTSPGWYVHMAATAWAHFGGGASTFMFATKVNSETLRDSIDDLKGQIAVSLPGQSTSMLLDEANIAAMVAEAEGIDVLSGEPDE